MRKIGLIADESFETKARVVLLKDLEKEISSESLVLVENGKDKILGILRKGLGKNELLSHERYRPDVAYAKLGGEPSGAREIFSFELIPLGVLEDGKLKPNRKIIMPRSPVFMFEEENPLSYIENSCKKKSYLNAYLEGHPSWRIPADANYIPYHVGIFGTTGTGKSSFTREVLIKFYRENNFSVLVLDWSGRDYAPFMKENTVHVSEIAMDEEDIIEFFDDILNFRRTRNDRLKELIEEIAARWRMISDNSSPIEILKEIDEIKEEYFNEYKLREPSKKIIEKSLRKIKEEHIKQLLGNMKVDDLLEKTFEEGLRIVDMSGFSSRAKLSFFLTLARKLEDLMISGMELNMALIIDEAPQYCPFKPEGIQESVTEKIKDLAALGRKHSLNLTLIAQGIAGEIGINAAVRRNLNTNFYGRLHPLDAAGQGGAKDWLEPYGITPDYLLNLEDGRFYFSGLMNPCPVPLLITYELR